MSRQFRGRLQGDDAVSARQERLGVAPGGGADVEDASVLWQAFGEAVQHVAHVDVFRPSDVLAPFPVVIGERRVAFVLATAPDAERGPGSEAEDGQQQREKVLENAAEHGERSDARGDDDRRHHERVAERDGEAAEPGKLRLRRPAALHSEIVAEE